MLIGFFQYLLSHAEIGAQNLALGWLVFSYGLEQHHTLRVAALLKFVACW